MSMPCPKRGRVALCALACVLAVVALLFAAPSAAYAEGVWTYNPSAKTLTNVDNVTLKNVTADDSGKLTIQGG